MAKISSTFKYVKTTMKFVLSKSYVPISWRNTLFVKSESLMSIFFLYQKSWCSRILFQENNVLKNFVLLKKNLAIPVPYAGKPYNVDSQVNFMG